MKMIIWDWNGTLLDDVDCCFEVLNKCLGKRNMPKLTSVGQYKTTFCFPVIKVYERLGFDFSVDSFEDISAEYTNHYLNDYSHCALHDNTNKILKETTDRGIANILLSASQIDVLNHQVKEYGCDRYFDKILGLDNIYAHSKVHLAKEFIVQSQIDPSEIVWVGDTIHDYECAQECGIQCILVSHGHHTKEKLETTKAVVVDNLEEVLDAAMKSVKNSVQ